MAPNNFFNRLLRRVSFQAKDGDSVPDNRAGSGWFVHNGVVIIHDSLVR
jgi:hypothetical protein